MSAHDSALVVGGSGLVGRELTRLLAAEPGVRRLWLPLRRPLPLDFLPAAGRGKVHPVLVDFEALGAHEEIFRVRQAFVCLGTTLRAAGSREAFRRVDHDLVLEVARRASAAGVEDLLLVSSLGASPRSPFFYSRVKGEVEARVSELPFRSVTLLRPSLLLGERERPRAGERAAAALGGRLSFLLRGPLLRWRPVQGSVVAAAMVAAAREPGRGVRVLESEEIVRLAARA